MRFRLSEQGISVIMLLVRNTNIVLKTLYRLCGYPVYQSGYKFDERGSIVNTSRPP